MQTGNVRVVFPPSDPDTLVTGAERLRYNEGAADANDVIALPDVIVVPFEPFYLEPPD